MALCNQIEEDVSIFLDLDDMATVHTIQIPGDAQARNITVVIDDDELQRNNLKSTDGIHDGNLLFFASSADIGEISENELIQFDGVPYQVIGIVDEDSMKQITLRAGMGGF